MNGQSLSQLETVRQKIKNVFPQPQVLTKILAATNDPQFSPEAIEKILTCEPSFALKLLTLAKSTCYGLPSQVTNLHAVLALLGRSRVRCVALHAGVKALFDFGTTNVIFTGQGLWQHSVSVGVCARMLSRRLKLGQAEDFFTMGILHDVGLIMEYQFLREGFLNVLSRLQEKKGHLLQLEREILDIDHLVLTEIFCQHWRIPRDISQILLYHHEPAEAPPELQRTAGALCVANHIVKNSQYGFHYPSEERIELDHLELLGINTLDLEVLGEDFVQESHDLTRVQA